MHRFTVPLLAILLISSCSALENMQMRQTPDGKMQFVSSSTSQSRDEAFGLLPKEEGVSVIEDSMKRNGWERDIVYPNTFGKGKRRCAIFYREKRDGTEITRVGTGGLSPIEYYIPAGTEDDIETCLQQLGLAGKE